MLCQCNEPSMDHAPGRCTGRLGLRRYLRAGVEVLLCCDCDLSDDECLEEDEEDDVDWDLEQSIERSEAEAECARLNRLRW